MTQAVAEILARMDGLSREERAELALAFVVSLEPEEDGVAEAWDAALAQRLAEIRSGNAVGKPAEQVFAELREKLA